MLKRFLLIILAASLMILPACDKNTGEKTPEQTTTQAQNTQTDPETNELRIRVATYNVKHFTMTDHTFDAFAEEIEKNGVEVIGLQEVDYCTSRSNGINEAKQLAEKLGWYYKFSPALAIKGGYFGHAILSKYPIESFDTVELSYQQGFNFESRSMGHVVIDVNGFKLNFLNTHLCHENEDNRIMQLKDIAAYVKNLDNFIITGDFNTNNYPLFSVIENSKLLNGNPAEFPTFPAKNTGIDNIIISLNFKNERPKISLSEISDHRMLYADVIIPLE